jgi:hypothetical protein
MCATLLREIPCHSRDPTADGVMQRVPDVCKPDGGIKLMTLASIQTHSERLRHRVLGCVFAGAPSGLPGRRGRDHVRWWTIDG